METQKFLYCQTTNFYAFKGNSKKKKCIDCNKKYATNRKFLVEFYCIISEILFTYFIVFYLKLVELVDKTILQIVTLINFT